jgi:hypothetical protein
VDLAAVRIEHPEVQLIQPTWHCLLRYRQRVKPAIGTDAAVAALTATLEDAVIDVWPPPWAAGQEAARWAVSGRFAFPLARAGDHGRWSAVTCLVA